MESTKVITGKVRFSYVNVFEPKAMNEGQEPKYSVSIIIPKEDKATIAKIKSAIDVALKEGVDNSKLGKTVPKNFKNPLRDGDEREDEAYADSYFINANSLTAPGVINSKRQALDNEEQFYSGCYGRASVNFYPFNVNGNKGIAVGLINLLKTEDGEPLGSVKPLAESDFADSLEEDDFLD